MLKTSYRVAEGWYPDPHGRLLQRRWNGDEWTAETMGDDEWVFGGDGAVPRMGLAKPECGWAGVAFALRSALVKRVPVQATVSLPALNSAFIVNTFDHQYLWLNEPEELPDSPLGVQVTFAPGDVSGGLRGRSLDGLLWKISMLGFPDRLAPWLQHDDLYRMQRWPNLTTINPELDDMRQAAMLANGMFSVEELAGFSDRSLTATRSLINALSLMNTLRVATPRDTNTMTLPVVPASQPATPAHKRSLFQRLRSKLGI